MTDERASAAGSSGFDGSQLTDERAIVCFATQGREHGDHRRIEALTQLLDAEMLPLERAGKLRAALALLRLGLRRRPRLFVMEGTGMAGGVPLIAMRALLGIPYVVSSGDAVGPYLGLRSRFAGSVGGIYERLLCRFCAGYVGWTPYLVGRALTFGAPRAMTAPGWPGSVQDEDSRGARQRMRAELGIDPQAIVVGLTGSIHFSPRRDYVYGSELVRAVRRCSRRDVVVCVVGDGSGLARLRELAGTDLGTRVLLPGRVAPQLVPAYLAAFDVGSLSQSVDGVGSFRYTTKLSEYLMAGLPVLTGQTPLAYDLDEGCMWRLPGAAPWSERYLDALVALLEGLTPEDLARRRAAVAARRGEPFDLASQQRRMRAFVEDLLA